MSRRLFSLFISAILILSMVNMPVFAQKEEAIVERRIEVLDSSSISVARNSGLSRSATFVKESDYSLYWGGEDIKRTIKLECAKDWSDGEFVEFWVYSPVKTSSSFAIAIISDNEETTCTDYYETVVQGNYKGWKIFSIPFSELSAVHSPVGFHSIDRIELWPSYGENKVSSEASFYFDNWYVSNVKSKEALKANNDLVLYDFTTGTETWDYDARYPNSGVKKSPDTGNYALWWGDLPRNYTGGVGNISFAPKESDWSFYNTLEINLYSEFDSEATIQFVCASDNPDTTSRDYYYEKVAVDWEEQRATIRLRIGKNGNQSSGGKPLGWDNITKLEFWFTNGTTDDSIRTNIYFENIVLRNIDYSLQWKEPQYIDAGPETDQWYDFAEKIKERYPGNAHPRLLVNSDELEWLKENYKTDTFLSSAFTKLVSQCEAAVDKNTTSPVTAAEEALSLAVLYNITGEEKYKEAVWEKVEAYSTNTSTWNTENSRLALGDTGRPAALVYDLMYNHWSEEERMVARNAMIIHLLRPERATILGTNGADTQITNWNPIINSGIGMVALAIADSPGYEDAANLVLNRIWRVLPNCFQYFGPDGAGFEGPDYWNYMMGNYLLYEAALYSSIGEVDYPIFSVLDEYGLEKTGDYAIHVYGANSTFNYYDGSARNISTGADFWLARYYNRPEFAGREYESGGTSTVKSMLVYRPNEGYASWRDDLELDYSAGGYVQFGAMRSSFAKGAQTTYVGYKGNGRNPATHGRLDAGAFVFDSQNTRFIELPSGESYSLPGMFGNKRYTYYRNRAEGSNTLVIGVGVNQNTSTDENDEISAQYMDQKYLSNCEIIKTESSVGAAYAVVDLTDAYSQTATSVKRGYALINGRDSFLLQDEITVSGSQDVYSFMHTTADIEISSDGKSAILKQKNGKMVKATLLSPSNAVLESYNAEPLAGSAGIIGDNNDIYRKLTVKTRLTGSGTISILFNPYYGEGNFEFALDGVIPISQWDKLLLDPVKIDGIYLAGTPIASFKENQLSYVVSEDSVCEVSAQAPQGVSLEITQASQIGDTALIKASDPEHTTVYSVSFSNEAQTRLDEWFYYAPKAFLCSANKSDIPYAVDGKFDTGWTNAGPQWLILDLGKPKEISKVLLYWNLNDQRQETFDISVSNDCENWDIVWEGMSVLSNDIVSYKFDSVTARYVKIMGYKNTKNDWTSINEVYIPSNGSGFTDVEDSWAKAAIEDMAKVGIVEGTTDTTFEPDAPLSRAAYITMLERAFGVEQGIYSGNIKDVGEYDWYTPYIEAAYMLNLIPEEMLIDGRFNPNQNITREEICALTMKFWEKYVGEVNPVSVERFMDKDKIAQWAIPYVGKALAERIITGVTSDTFVPIASATRAQAATILKRIYIKTYK